MFAAKGARAIWLLAALILTACSAGDVGPINSHAEKAPPPSPEFVPDPGDDGSMVIGLAFSGGGVRASAFSYGVLRALDDIVVDQKPYRRTMIDNVRMISGVSGGAITAAYFGYRGRDDYRDFDARFLFQHAEASMQTSLASPFSLSRALAGGVNDRNTFARWLNDNLFDGADFTRFKWTNAPSVWITASDIYNRTPFIFDYDTFVALCSDLDKLKISDAVAASAAAPVVFAPVVLAATKQDCGYRRPTWLKEALSGSNPSTRLTAYANALQSYHAEDGIKFVRLMDGGLTDNLGITGFVLERSASKTPHGPLSAEQAVKLRHFLFIVADAGRGQTEDWGASINGPWLGPLVEAASDTGMTSSSRHGLDALKFAVDGWKERVVRYRCGLPLETVRRIRGSTEGWDCRKVDFKIEHLEFSDLEPNVASHLNRVETRLSLPREQVELLVEAGKTVVRQNMAVKQVVGDIRRAAGLIEGD